TTVIIQLDGTTVKASTEVSCSKGFTVGGKGDNAIATGNVPIDHIGTIPVTRNSDQVVTTNGITQEGGKVGQILPVGGGIDIAIEPFKVEVIDVINAICVADLLQATIRNGAELQGVYTAIKRTREVDGVITSTTLHCSELDNSEPSITCSIHIQGVITSTAENRSSCT